MKFEKNTLFSLLFATLIASPWVVKAMDTNQITQWSGEQWYQQAKKCEQSNKMEEAVTSLKNAAQLEYPKGLLNLGKHYLSDSSEYSNGLDCIQRAIAKDSLLSKRVVEFSPRRDIATRLDLANLLLNSSDTVIKNDGLTVTENILNEVLTKEPNNKELLHKIYNAACYTQAKTMLNQTNDFQESTGLLEYKAVCEGITNDVYSAISSLSVIENPTTYLCLADLYLRQNNAEQSYQCCKKALEKFDGHNHEMVVWNYLYQLEGLGCVAARIDVLGNYANRENKADDDHNTIKVLLQKLKLEDGLLLQENKDAYKALKEYVNQGEDVSLQRSFANYVIHSIHNNQSEKQEALNRLEALAQDGDSMADFLLIRHYLNDNKTLVNAIQVIQREDKVREGKKINAIFCEHLPGLALLADQGNSCASWLCFYAYAHRLGSKELEDREADIKALDYASQTCLQKSCPAEIYDGALGYLETMAVRTEQTCIEHCIRAWGHLCSVYAHTNAQNYLVEASCNKISDLIKKNRTNQEHTTRFFTILKEIKVFDALKTLSNASAPAAQLLADCYGLSAAMKRELIDDNNTVLDHLLCCENYLKKAQEGGKQVDADMVTIKNIIGTEYRLAKNYDKALEYFRAGSTENFLDAAKLYIEQKHNFAEGTTWLIKAMKSNSENAIRYAYLMAPQLEKYGITKELLNQYADSAAAMIINQEISLLTQCDINCSVVTYEQMKKDKDIDPTHPAVIYLRGVDAFYHNQYEQALVYLKQAEENNIFFAKGYKALIMGQDSTTIDESLKVAMAFFNACGVNGISSTEFFLHKAVLYMINRIASNGNISAQCLCIKKHTAIYEKHRAETSEKVINEWLDKCRDTLGSFLPQDIADIKKAFTDHKLYINLKKFFTSSRSPSFVNLLMNVISRNINLFDMPDSCYIEDIQKYYGEVEGKEYNRIGKFLSTVYTKKAKDSENQQNEDNTITLYKKALTYNGNNYDAHVGLAEFLLDNKSDEGSIQEVLTHLHKAADKGNHIVAQKNLGYIYCGLFNATKNKNIKKVKDIDKGLSYMQKIVDRDKPSMKVTIASIYFIDKKDATTAIRYLDKAQDAGLIKEAMYYRGYIEYVRSNYKEAKGYFSDQSLKDDVSSLCYLLLIALPERKVKTIKQYLGGIVAKAETDASVIGKILSLDVMEQLKDFLMIWNDQACIDYYNKMGNLVATYYNELKDSDLDILEGMLARLTPIDDMRAIERIEKFITDKKIINDAAIGHSRSAYYMAYFTLKKKDKQNEELTDEEVAQFEAWLKMARNDKECRTRAGILLASVCLGKFNKSNSDGEKIKLLVKTSYLIMDAIRQEDTTTPVSLHIELKLMLSTTRSYIVLIESNLTEEQRKVVDNLTKKLDEYELKLNELLQTVEEPLPKISNNN